MGRKGKDAAKSSHKGQYDVARLPPKMIRGRLAPDSFELDGHAYRLEKHLKADFFAATGRYADESGRRVCLKHFHTESFWLIPLGWAGRYMCNREIGFYRHLEDVQGVPALVGKLGTSGMVHEWIEGCDLLDVRREEQAEGGSRAAVSDTFFDELEALALELHSRGVAYVDLNKPDNVLVGDDGRPYLVDFQISFRQPRQRWRLFGRWLFKVLTREDLYHVRKLKRKFRRDLMSPEEIERSYQRSFILSAHRRIAPTFQRVRRWVLRKLGAR
jgi:serine/threonine protein kinase